MRTVITVSRQIGTDGDLIARNVAESLGFQYLDKKLLAEQAEKSGINISEAEACDISEDDYRVRGFVESIFGDKKIITIIESTQVGSSLIQHPRVLDEDACMKVEGTLIKELAKKGRIVIVGRGGQALLRDTPWVLSAKIVASYEFRVQNLMKEKRISNPEAERVIEERDAATEHYLRKFYHIEWDDPSNYDITLNMEKLSFQTAVSSIINLARTG